jgi:hypothetical protein
MKNDPSQPDPWMLEDVQLRCQLAARRWEAALSVGQKCKEFIPLPLVAEFEQMLADIGGVKRRALAYAYHIRETNLSTILRRATKLGIPLPQRSIEELQKVMEADLMNYREEVMAVGQAESYNEWKEMERALALLDQDLELFLKEFLQVTVNEDSKGKNSITSR